MNLYNHKNVCYIIDSDVLILIKKAYFHDIQNLCYQSKFKCGNANKKHNGVCRDHDRCEYFFRIVSEFVISYFLCSHFQRFQCSHIHTEVDET